MTGGENQQGHLEPKPPELLQKLKWLRIHGWQYRWYVVAGAVVLAASSLGPRLLNPDAKPQPTGSRTLLNEAIGGRNAESRKESEIGADQPLGIRSRREAIEADTADATKEGSIRQSERAMAAKVFLTTGETPDDIMKALSHLYGSDRDERARELYVGRWISEPGWTGVVFGLPSMISDGTWVFSITHELRDGSESRRLTYLISKQDAASLRPGMRVRVTGKVKEVDILEVSLEETSFEVLNQKREAPSVQTNQGSQLTPIEGAGEP